jgi:DUF4097 and DUF4098 domain-containing protein YvlB
MRRRSLTGPLMLLLIGGLFLWHNLHPEAPIFDMVSQYWPFLLIIWGMVRLVEVFFSREDGYRGSFTGGEIMLVVLLCVAGMAIFQARQYGIRFNTGGLQWFGEQYDYPVSGTAPAAGMKRIVFENPRGNIKVTGGDVQEVTVNGHKYIRAYNRTDADRTNGSTPLDVVPQGDQLLIRTNQDHAPDNQRVSDDLEVVVPHAMAVEARGGNNGDFEIVDITGSVEVASSRGDVRLSKIGGDARVDVGRSNVVRVVDVKGKVDLQGRGSDVELENISGQVTINGAYDGTLEFKNLAKPLQFEGARNTQLNVQAVPGQISMDRGEFSGSGLVGPVKLVTNARDIKMAKFTQSLELETQHGDVELQPGLPVPAIEARSGFGKVVLILPDKAAFRLDATADRGDAMNDYGAPIVQERDGRSATLKGSAGNGPVVHLTAHRGSIEVRKEGMESSGDDANPPAPPKPPKSPTVKDLKDSEIKM